MAQDEGSPTTTPQTASRATTPGLTSIPEEPLVFDRPFEPELDIGDLLDDPDMGFGAGLNPFDYDPMFSFDGGLDAYTVDKVSSDSGYVSTSTMTMAAFR